MPFSESAAILSVSFSITIMSTVLLSVLFCLRAEGKISKFSGDHAQS